MGTPASGAAVCMSMDVIQTRGASGRRSSNVLVVAAALGFAGCAPTAPALPRVWGSDQVGVSVLGGVATFQFLASGECYGAFGVVPAVIPSGSFALSGTYSQLIGAYPGRIDHAAVYTGAATQNTMRVSIVVPDLPQTLGPFTLAAGVAKSWPACAYP